MVPLAASAKDLAAPIDQIQINVNKIIGISKFIAENITAGNEVQVQQNTQWRSIHHTQNGNAEGFRIQE